jgi:hypothetical protein
MRIFDKCDQRLLEILLGFKFVRLQIPTPDIVNGPEEQRDIG